MEKYILRVIGSDKKREKVIKKVKAKLNIKGIEATIEIPANSDLQGKSLDVLLKSEESSYSVYEILLGITRDDENILIVSGSPAPSKPREKTPLIAAPSPIIIQSEKYPVAKKVITLLSNHRLPNNPEKALSLTKRQILSLLISSMKPEYPQAQLIEELESTLKTLEIEGEIYAGFGNRFCVARPTILYEELCEEALFIGDRAYLSSAHQILGNRVTEDTKLIFPDGDFKVLKQRFLKCGISLITIHQSLQHLPDPRKPLTKMLRGYEVEDPLINPDYAGILHYVPQWGKQNDRWRELSHSDLLNSDLLRLSTGEYLWYEQGIFYQLKKDDAILAMFKLDRESGQLIQIAWDSDCGHLNLKNIILPNIYAQYLWRLSTPTDSDNRMRYVEPNRRKQIEEILRKLGCEIV